MLTIYPNNLIIKHYTGNTIYYKFLGLDGFVNIDIFI